MIEVQLQSAEQWESLRSQIAGHGGALVPCAPNFEPQLWATVPVRFVAEGRVIADVEGQVVHASGAGEVALTFVDPARTLLVTASYFGGAQPPIGDPVERPTDGDWGAADTANVPAIAEDDAALDTEDEDGGAGADDDAWDDAAWGDDDDDEDDDGSVAAARGHEAPLWKRYLEMAKPEKMKLARTGNRVERRMVLKDRDASLHLQLLNNPGLKGGELAGYIKSGMVSGQLLRAICDRGDLVRIPAVSEALVMHPQTPVDLAERLVDRISIDLCRRIAKQGKLKQKVVAAAKKRVISKGR